MRTKDAVIEEVLDSPAIEDKDRILIEVLLDIRDRLDSISRWLYEVREKC